MYPGAYFSFKYQVVYSCLLDLFACLFLPLQKFAMHSYVDITYLIGDNFPVILLSHDIINFPYINWLNASSTTSFFFFM